MLEINKVQRLYLGVKGENLARTIEIDVNAWFTMYPNASFSIWHKRQGDEGKQATGATFDRETGILSWMPTSADTFYAGEGIAEIRMTEGEVIRKTRDVTTTVAESLTTGSGETIESEWQAYLNVVESYKNAAESAAEATEEAAQQIHEVEQYVEAAREAATSAEGSVTQAATEATRAAESAAQAAAAVGHYPRISATTGNWEVWNQGASAWVDTGVHAEGPRGLKGDTGDAADITGTAYAYQISESGDTVPTGSWSPTRPVTPQGSYLWERVTLTWNSGDTTVLYTVSRMGIDGSGSVVSVCGVSPDARGNVALTAANVGAAAANHTHDDRYYTEGETNNLLAEKLDAAEFDAEHMVMSADNPESVKHRIESIEGQNYVKSVNGVQADGNGNAEINIVDYAYGIATDESQPSSGEFVERTTGGSSSLTDGDAWLATVRGGRIHTGHVPESLQMTVTMAERSGEDSAGTITCTLDRDTFVGYVGASGTVTLTHDGTDWSADPALYGITVTGTPIAEDQIVVVYVAEVRGTITMATPTAFRSTGWNLYNHTTGYARVLKYSDAYGFRIDGTYTSLEFSETLSGARSAITVTGNKFTVPADGYVWVTGGNGTDTCIYMTWSDWGSGHDGSWQGYTESVISLASAMANFPNGLMQVGGVRDTLDFDLGTATSYIERMAYSAENLATAKASGREYEYDENYIYIVRETPVQYEFAASREYTAYDHGMEYFSGTAVGCFASMQYGENLVDKLRHDIPQQLTALDTKIANVQDGLAIIADGNTHAAIAKGQAVFVRSHSTLAAGLYWASSAIGANAALSTSNLTPDNQGGLNKLKADLDSLNSNFVNSQTLQTYTYNNAARAYKVGRFVYISCAAGSYFCDAGDSIKTGSATGTPWILPEGFRPLMQCEIKEALNAKRITVLTDGRVTCNEALSNTNLRFSGMFVCA